MGLQNESLFNRELDNVNWRFSSSINQQKTDYDFGYNALLTGRLFLINNSPQNTQDEISLNSWYSGNLTKFISSESSLRYFSFTNTEITTLNAYTGIRFKLPYASIKPQIGYYSDERSGSQDDGVSLGGSVTFSPLQLSKEFTTKLNGSSIYADINPRVFQSHKIESNSIYRTEALTMNLDGIFSFNERDSYQPSSFFNRNATDIIEKILSDTTQFDFQIRAPLSNQLNFSASVQTLFNVRNYENKPIEETTSNTIIDTRYSRQDLFSNVQIQYQSDWLSNRTGVNYTISTLDAKITQALNATDDQLNRREEQLQNTFYDQDQVEAYTQNTIQLSNSHQIDINGRVSILRFDTPITNFDDRDELYVAFDLQDNLRLNKYFKTSIMFAGEAYHRVFLFSERSIENNWRRSIRVQPNLQWTPNSAFSLQSQFLVRANYTVYDFENRDGTIRDQSSREFGISFIKDWNFTSNFNWESTYSRNQLMIGQLFWSDFSETPLDTLTTTRIESEIQYQKNGLSIALGFRIFIKDDYLPTTVVRITQDDQILSRFASGNQQTVQIGPKFKLQWNSSKYGEIAINGWYQLQYLRNDWYLSLEDQFKDALNRERAFRRTRIFPNIQISTKLYL